VAIYTGAKALSRWPINDESTLTLVSEFWHHGLLSRGKSWVNDVGKSDCYNLPPILRGLLIETCFSEESDIP
jgi:hypothetical protein